MGRLTLHIDAEAPRQSFAGVMTRAQARAARQRQHARMEEGTDSSWEPRASSGDTPSMERSWHQHSVTEPWQGSGSGDAATSHMPSHAPDYHQAGPSNVFGRDAGRSASARFHHTDMDDLNTSMGGMSLREQRLYEEVHAINECTIEMQRQIQANSAAIGEIGEWVVAAEDDAYQFYAHYYYHNP